VLHNCPEFVIAFLASAALRAVFLPLNPQYTRDALSPAMLSWLGGILARTQSGLSSGGESGLSNRERFKRLASAI
jgi:acyl-coenzyme A synthetase/AMP-(fatty) acid ligase